MRRRQFVNALLALAAFFTTTRFVQAKPKRCAYCWHDLHDIGVCGVFIGRHACACDNRTQRFYVSANSQEMAKVKADKIRASGYEVYQYSYGEVFGRASLTKNDWRLACHSNTLSPVASYGEFLRRVGLEA